MFCVLFVILFVSVENVTPVESLPPLPVWPCLAAQVSCFGFGWLNGDGAQSTFEINGGCTDESNSLLAGMPQMCLDTMTGISTNTPAGSNKYAWCGEAGVMMGVSPADPAACAADSAQSLPDDFSNIAAWNDVWCGSCAGVSSNTPVLLGTGLWGAVDTKCAGGIGCGGSGDYAVYWAGNVNFAGTRCDGHLEVLPYGHTLEQMKCYCYPQEVHNATTNSASGNIAGGGFILVNGNYYCDMISWRVQIGGNYNQSSNCTRVSQTQVNCTIPRGLGRELMIYTLSANKSVTLQSGSALFSYNGPVATSISPSIGIVTGGTNVTINGTNFGFTVSDVSSVYIGSFQCTLVTMPISITQIRCTTSAGTGSNLPIIITRVDGSQNTSAGLFTYAVNGCDGVLNSGAIYDACNVCNGTNRTCAGCDGIPNSGIRYDLCGICNGTNRSCAGCDGVPNSNKIYDVCGVCNGNNKSCAGCNGVPYSGLVYDACGVCNGSNQTCRGCDGVLNSNLIYDRCGICGGNNKSCAGCNGVPNSGVVYDACGVCNGTNTTCTDCTGVIAGPVRYDYCGVCGGDNSTCIDCAGIYHHLNCSSDNMYLNTTNDITGSGAAGLLVTGSALTLTTWDNRGLFVTTLASDSDPIVRYDYVLSTATDFGTTRPNMLHVAGTAYSSTYSFVYVIQRATATGSTSPAGDACMIDTFEASTGVLRHSTFVNGTGAAGGLCGSTSTSIQTRATGIWTSMNMLYWIADLTNDTVNWVSLNSSGFPIAASWNQTYFTSAMSSTGKITVDPVTQNLWYLPSGSTTISYIGVPYNLGASTRSFTLPLPTGISTTLYDISWSDTLLLVGQADLSSDMRFMKIGVNYAGSGAIWKAGYYTGVVGTSCVAGLSSAGGMLVGSGKTLPFQAQANSTFLRMSGSRVNVGNCHAFMQMTLNYQVCVSIGPSTFARVDSCGVCNGTNSTCLDCAGIPNGGRIYDACGVCGGNNLSCAGCDGIPNSGRVYDACGVCNGTNRSCAGCDGVPNSGKVYDSCGVCNGTNATCTGCDGVVRPLPAPCDRQDIVTILGNASDVGVVNDVGLNARFGSVLSSVSINLFATPSQSVLWIADTSNNLIREVTYPGLSVTTVYGNGGGGWSIPTKEFGSPIATVRGLYSGTTYADCLIANGRFCIICVEAPFSTNLLATIGLCSSAGTTNGVFGAAQFGQPTAIAYDNSTNVVYVSERNVFEVPVRGLRKFDLKSDGIVGSLLPASSNKSVTLFPTNDNHLLLIMNLDISSGITAMSILNTVTLAFQSYHTFDPAQGSYGAPLLGGTTSQTVLGSTVYYTQIFNTSALIHYFRIQGDLDVVYSTLSIGGSNYGYAQDGTYIQGQFKSPTYILPLATDGTYLILDSSCMRMITNNSLSQFPCATQDPIPIYDACGICAGSNTSCAGCDGVPNSGVIYDVCGVCNGSNSTCRQGCDNVPFSTIVYDACGVCGGNNCTCGGCLCTPSNVVTYDTCGVCGGNNQTCSGCDGVPYSGLSNDACGVCNGTNSTCTGCDGIVYPEICMTYRSAAISGRTQTGDQVLQQNFVSSDFGTVLYPYYFAGSLFIADSTNFTIYAMNYSTHAVSLLFRGANLTYDTINGADTGPCAALGACTISGIVVAQCDQGLGPEYCNLQPYRIILSFREGCIISFTSTTAYADQNYLWHRDTLCGTCNSLASGDGSCSTGDVYFQSITSMVMNSMISQMEVYALPIVVAEEIRGAGLGPMWIRYSIGDAGGYFLTQYLVGFPDSTDANIAIFPLLTTQNTALVQQTCIAPTCSPSILGLVQFVSDVVISVEVLGPNYLPASTPVLAATSLSADTNRTFVGLLGSVITQGPTTFLGTDGIQGFSVDSSVQTEFQMRSATWLAQSASPTEVIFTDAALVRIALMNGFISTSNCSANPNVSRYDACGICEGNNQSCAGCDGIPNSGAIYDRCGVCGGNNRSCQGCDGVPNSGKIYDSCGVCNGTNRTCAGCDGIPNSGILYDSCGVCAGNNCTCGGCLCIPLSNSTYDACGICGGNATSNSSCGSPPPSPPPPAPSPPPPAPPPPAPEPGPNLGLILPLSIVGGLALLLILSYYLRSQNSAASEQYDVLANLEDAVEDIKPILPVQAIKDFNILANVT